MPKINRRVKQLVSSSTLAITARAKELRQKGVDVVNFAGGEPDFDTPDVIKQAAVVAINNGLTKYTPSIGTLELREQIVRKFKEENNISYDVSQIAVSCGAKHSLFSIVQVLVDEGDEVLIPAPYWVSYPEMVKLAGGVSKIIPTSPQTNFKLTAQRLSENISDNSKVLILNSPSNPTGMLYSKEELEAIAEVCVKNNLFVISDEIYEKIIFDTDTYTSIASLGPDIYKLTITVNGVSKAYSMTGWRIGYCAGDKEIIGYVKKIQDHSTSNPSSISQAAALEALRSAGKDALMMAAEFKKRRDIITSGMDEISGISYIKPEGAFYLFCDFSKFGDSIETAKSILDEVNVAVIPGDGFGAPGFMRMSFATSSEKIKEGIRRISDWVKKHA